MKKNKTIMTIIVGLMCLVLFTVMFMQFKTIEETDITAIENMRESELRTAISEWKTKYEEMNKKLEEVQKSINEYKNKLDKNEETSELVDKELHESNTLLGKTDVYGEGVVVTLSDNDEKKIKASDLIVLVNELKYGGAEAISINDIRITNDTEITFIDNSYIIIGSEQRISSPYVVKAIGNTTYLSSVLSLKDSGFIDKYTSSGKTVSFETRKRIDILKYSGYMSTKYINLEEEK